MHPIRVITFSACALIGATSLAAAQERTLEYTCDINGAPARMIMVVETISASGINTGVNGDISGVYSVGTRVYTSGQIVSETAGYTFTGENQFADFTSMTGYERFRVQWKLDEPKNGLWAIVNPFGNPTSYFCAYEGSLER